MLLAALIPILLIGELQAADKFWGEGKVTRLRSPPANKYTLVRQLLNHEDAAAYCRQNDAELATFPSLNDWHVVRRQLEEEHAEADAKVEQGFKKPCQNDWLGGRMNDQGEWMWNSGEKIRADDPLWAPGQPAKDANLKCLSRYGKSIKGRSLYATNCADKHWVVCQRRV